MAVITADQAAYARMRTNGIIRQNASVPLRQRRLILWASIITEEITRGTRFLITKPDGVLYVICGVTNEIMSIPRFGRGGDKFLAYLHTYYGLSEHDDYCKFIYSALRSHGLSQGSQVELRRFSAYKDATVYLNAYDGHMWKCEGTGIPAKVPNGTDDVFFIDDDGGEPVKVDITIEDHKTLFDVIADVNFAVGLGGITPKLQRIALIIWTFALALPDLMPTKPLLLLEGNQGAGKSLTVQRIQYALMGSTKPMILSRNKEDDFGILLLRSPIAVFDNTDSYIEWVADSICAYTTLGIFPRRKLYSDDEEVIIKPHAFVAVASKNPASFRREDVADRSIILRLDRRPTFVPAAQIKASTLLARPKIIGEYLWYLDQIVAEIRRGMLEEALTLETHRMADFAAFGRVVAKVCGWDESVITEMMDALQSERDSFVSEEDPLVELLHRWCAYQPRGGQRNVGREMAINPLYNELESIAQATGQLKSWYKSPRILAQKIRSPHITRDFIVQEGRAHGQKTYKLWRKTDPKLELVEPVSDEDKSIFEG